MGSKEFAVCLNGEADARTDVRVDVSTKCQSL